MPTSLIRQLVERPVSAGRSHPACAQVREHLVHADVAVPVEVDELHVVEDRSSRKASTSRSRDTRLAAVVRLARLEHRRVDTFRIVDVRREDVAGQPGLEELAARQAGDDVADPPFARDVHAERVDRLEAAVADVREARQAVAEDRVHCGRAAPVVSTPRAATSRPMLALALPRVAVVERKRERQQPSDEPAEHKVLSLPPLGSTMQS